MKQNLALEQRIGEKRNPIRVGAVSKRTYWEDLFKNMGRLSFSNEERQIVRRTAEKHNDPLFLFFYERLMDKQRRTYDFPCTDLTEWLQPEGIFFGYRGM